MRKEIFALSILLLLVATTYWLGGGKNTTQVPKEQLSSGQSGVIQITGLVERPYNITYEELRKFPSREVESPLYCVSQPDQVRKNGTWKGVPLKAILELARPRGGAYKVALYASDGFTTDFYLDAVMADEDIIIAYEFNGEPITPRIVAPGRWGYKWIKYLTRIELVSYDFKGTWESAGYPDDALILDGSSPGR
ncbi:molybdopterin-dependent oxidoreductase [Thermococcus sp.]|uniref:molybdopterin-dependent oxidoreductase n=1 Tax=Thermococcus sp. TaxID=35749 RepID=UPI0025E26725|nr:molybdopterin-dependent oxidoreductase [Thermococcus sp.]